MLNYVGILGDQTSLLHDEIVGESINKETETD